MTLALAAHVLNLLAWIAIGLVASVCVGVGMTERRDDCMWTGLGLYALVFIRSLVWLFS